MPQGWKKEKKDVEKIGEALSYLLYYTKMKKEREVPLEEFKFHYEIANSIGASDKYFMAHDLDEASEMFEHACLKRNLDAQVTRVEKWNRWKSTWETLDVPSEDSMRN